MFGVLSWHEIPRQRHDMQSSDCTHVQYIALNEIAHECPLPVCSDVFTRSRNVFNGNDCIFSRQQLKVEWHIKDIDPNTFSSHKPTFDHWEMPGCHGTD